MSSLRGENLPFCFNTAIKKALFFFIFLAPGLLFAVNSDNQLRKGDGVPQQNASNNGGDELYQLKLYLDLQTPKKEIFERYSKQTAEFLFNLAREVNRALKEELLSEDVVLFFRNGLPSDYTITYSFPRAYIKEISQTEEINGNRYTRFGLKIDIDLALYVFKTSVPPRLVYYKVYSYRKYIPPKGDYLPTYTSLTEFIGKSFSLQIVKDLRKFIRKEKAELEFYKNIK